MAGCASLRWVRALALAVVLLGSGVSLHVAAGGSAPGASILGPLFLLVVAAVSLFLDSLTSVVRVTVVVVAGQVMLHVALMMLAGPTTIHAQHSASMSMTAGSSAEGWSECLSRGSLAMVLAHCAATAAVGLWLVIGERAVWTLLRLAANPALDAWRWLRVLSENGAGRLVHPRAWSLVLCGVVDRLSLSGWAGRGLSRRGPPRSYAT
jgi:hypothetical protein